MNAFLVEALFQSNLDGVLDDGLPHLLQGLAVIGKSPCPGNAIVVHSMDDEQIGTASLG